MKSLGLDDSQLDSHIIHCHQAQESKATMYRLSACLVRLGKIYMYLISGALLSRPLFSRRENGEYRWHLAIRLTRRCIAPHALCQGCTALGDLRVLEADRD